MTFSDSKTIFLVVTNHPQKLRNSLVTLSGQFSGNPTTPSYYLYIYIYVQGSDLLLILFSKEFLVNFYTLGAICKSVKPHGLILYFFFPYFKFKIQIVLLNQNLQKSSPAYIVKLISSNLY
jgi:hypothetical protein